MVGWTMDGPARDRVLKLIEEKDRMESEIRDQTAVLEANHIGMHESLVDDLGYPRNDIDVYKVRHARLRIICLQNDHKNIMKMIESGLAEVHADLLGSNGEGPSNAHTSSNGHIANGHLANGHLANGHMANGHLANGHVGNGHVGILASETRDTAARPPFAVVTMVTDGSPADLDGLLAEDKIVQFGSVTHANFQDMTQIYNIVSHSVGQQITVRVRRGDITVNISLVPRQWAQAGLLGCHIQRLS